MIRFEHVTKRFADGTGDAVLAVDDLTLEVAAGETLCLIGTSGCGKTTALRMVNRLIDPSAGRVLVDGRDVRERDLTELRRSIGYVIQSGGLFPHLDVARNLTLLCRLAGWDRERIAVRARDLLALVGLDPAEFADRMPAALSGGQRQRVGLARALALDPPILLMDEPFGALDPITRSELHEEFAQLADRVAKTVLLVTHDMPEAFQLGHRVALMAAGRLVQVGTEADFRRRPATPFVEAFMRAHFVGAE